MGKNCFYFVVRHGELFEDFNSESLSRPEQIRSEGRQPVWTIAANARAWLAITIKSIEWQAAKIAVVRRAQEVKFPRSGFVGFEEGCRSGFAHRIGGEVPFDLIGAVETEASRVQSPAITHVALTVDDKGILVLTRVEQIR